MNWKEITLREFIKIISVVTVGLALSGCASSKWNIAGIANEPKNILFIATDDLRFELGCYGDTQVITPNLDRLAMGGLMFNRAYCQQAVCNPSRASLLTGLRPDTIQVWDLKTHFRDTMPDLVTLPQYFKQNGYHTQCIGKIFHNDAVHNEEGKIPMWDPVSWSVPAMHATGPHWKDWVVPGNPSGPKKKQGATQFVDVPDNAYYDGQIAEEAVKALRQYGDRPFFLAVGFWKPHLPFAVPKKYWDLYDRAKLTPPKNPYPPKNVPDIALHNWHELRNYKGIPKEGPLSSEQIMELRHGYYAAISYLDAQVGKVLKELDRQGLTDNTIIVFWSDHGFHLGEHDLWCKTTNFELDTRVPLIISVPDQKHSGVKTDALVELIDLYPTLAELCGLPVPKGLEGVSMAPLIKDPNRPWKKVVFSQHPRPFYGKVEPTVMGYSIRTERFRYTEWRSIKNGEVQARELYDHQRDPGETFNLINEPGYADDIKRLAQQLRAGPLACLPSEQR